MDDNEVLAEVAEEGGFWTRLVVFVVVAVAAIVAYVLLRDVLTLAALAREEAELRALQERQPILMYGGAFLLYVLVVALSLPIASVLTLAYAWFFGFLPTIVMVSFASTTGATLAFLLSRYLFRRAIQRHFGKRLVRFNEALRREGPYFLFTLRVVPAVPFFVINALMGLTPMSIGTFWWVSQLGMLPGTLVIAYAGSIVPSLQLLAEEGVAAVFTGPQLAQLVVALVLLGVFPFAARWAVRALRRVRFGTH